MQYLEGLYVHVEAHSVAAGYAAWLLRSYGAAVTCTSTLDPDGIGAFLTPDTAAPGGEPAVLVTDVPVTDEGRAWVTEQARRARTIWITAWGLEQPWASMPATPLTLQAAGGWMTAVGEPDREPLSASGNQPLFMAGLWAAIAALQDADRPGLSVVSIAEAVTATMIYEPVAYQYYGRVRQRVGNRYGAANPCIATLPVRDGHIGFHGPLHRQWLAFCHLAGCSHLADDDRFRTNPARAEHLRELDEEIFLPWLQERTRWQAYHELQRAGIPASATPDLSEVLASPQLKARDAWREVRVGGKPVRMPGPPAREVATAQSPERVGRGRWRVVELAMGWAGPMAAHLMAAMGADVIKVEGPERYDWWRGARAPGEDTDNLFERSHVFNSVNRGKRGVTIDFSTAEGRGELLALVEDADVLIENFQAGVLERHGLSWEVLSERNPALILIRQPAFGSTGPESDYRAFGNTIEGMSGLTSLVGYPDGLPTMMSNAMGDPVSGLNATIALQAALRARDRDGRGRCVEVAQLEGFLPMVSEELMAYQVTGELPRRRGNARPGSAFAAVVRAAGDDTWIAVECTSDQQLEALDALVGDGLEDWAAQYPAEEAVERLLAAGVPVAKVNAEPDLVGSTMLAGAGFWELIDREFVGAHLYPGVPILADGERWQTGIPAPTLGQHTDDLRRGPWRREPAAVE